MDAVVHCAAKVDDAGSYEAFARTNLAGTEEASGTGSIGTF